MDGVRHVAPSGARRDFSSSNRRLRFDRESTARLLVSASFHNHIRTVKFLLDRGVGINRRYRMLSGLSFTPIAAAAHNGHVDLVRWLVSQGADLHAQSSMPFAVACRNGHLGVVQLILSHHNLYNPLELGRGLVNAARHGQVEILEVLASQDPAVLQSGIDAEDVEDALPKAFLCSRIPSVIGPLLRIAHVFPSYQQLLDSCMGAAAQTGNVWLVESLLQYGARPSAPPSFDRGALCIAVKHGHVLVVRLLLAQGRVSDEELGRALLNALTPDKIDRVDIAQALLSAGANEVLLRNPMDFLFVAIAQSEAPMVACLWQAGARWVYARADDEGPVATAARFGRVATLDTLRTLGCDLRAHDEQALRSAVQAGRCDSVQYLLEHGADLRARDSEAVRQAVLQADPPMLELLLRFGADPGMIAPALAQSRPR